MTSNAQLFLGDCLEIMPTLGTGGVDAVITDPPYGNGMNYASYNDTKAELRRLVGGFMPQVLRISDRVIITPGVANLWVYPEPTWTLAWVNPGGGAVRVLGDSRVGNQYLLTEKTLICKTGKAVILTRFSSERTRYIKVFTRVLNQIM